MKTSKSFMVFLFVAFMVSLFSFAQDASAKDKRFSQGIKPGSGKGDIKCPHCGNLIDGTDLAAGMEQIINQRVEKALREAGVSSGGTG
ncbi:MAG: hypothetical protein HQM10_20200 [Candidatus Riflebacteria bacterium]|nr:hypothetical protein [Candidatus Riflebacteria bacterium]